MGHIPQIASRGRKGQGVFYLGLDIDRSVLAILPKERSGKWREREKIGQVSEPKQKMLVHQEVRDRAAGGRATVFRVKTTIIKGEK